MNFRCDDDEADNQLENEIRENLTLRENKVTPNGDGIEDIVHAEGLSKWDDCDIESDSEWMNHSFSDDDISLRSAEGIFTVISSSLVVQVFIIVLKYV